MKIQCITVIKFIVFYFWIQLSIYKDSLDTLEDSSEIIKNQKMFYINI